MFEAGYTVEHEIYENGRFVTLEYRLDGYSLSGNGLWLYRVKGSVDWLHVHNPLVRRRLDAGRHSREGDRCSLLYVIERLTNAQFDAFSKIEYASLAFV